MSLVIRRKVAGGFRKRTEMSDELVVLEVKELSYVVYGIISKVPSE